MSRLNEKIDRAVRVLPFVMSACAVMFAVACGKNNNGKQHLTKVPVGAGAADKAATADAKFGALANSSKPENLAFSQRLEGATAYVKPVTDAANNHVFHVKVMLLLGGERKEIPALQIVGTGDLTDGAGDGLGAAVKQKNEDKKRSILDGAKLVTGEDSSPEASRYSVLGFCMQSCSQLVIWVAQGAASSEDQSTTPPKFYRVLAKATDAASDPEPDAAKDADGVDGTAAIPVQTSSLGARYLLTPPTAQMLGAGRGAKGLDPTALTVENFYSARKSRTANKLPISLTPREQAALGAHTNKEKAPVAVDGATQPTKDQAVTKQNPAQAQPPAGSKSPSPGAAAAPGAPAVGSAPSEPTKDSASPQPTAAEAQPIAQSVRKDGTAVDQAADASASAKENSAAAPAANDEPKAEQVPTS